MITSADLSKELETIAVPAPENGVSGGYTSDLLSDVMGHAKQGDVLITIQSHKNTVAVAALVGITAIILCNSRPVPEDMIEAAKQEDINLFRTSDNQFDTSCRIRRLLDA